MPKALVVDDEADAREFVRAILEPEGWEVEEAADGLAAMEKAKANPPDLMVLDVEMPEASGFEVFTELNRTPALADVRVVVLTGVADKLGMRFKGQDLANFLGRQPEAYVEKPIDPDTFLRIVKDATVGG
jgi:two-component system alkaline phosphatase synthesis response regulator PhoP